MKFIDHLRSVKHRYEKSRRLKHVKNKLRHKIETSSLYKQADLDACFTNRGMASSTTFVERIINAYLKATYDQKLKPAPYQVGNEWLPIYKDRMKEIIGFLEQGDVSRVQSIYDNFMREDCSYGLHGLPFDMHSAYFNGKVSKLNREIYLYDFVHRLQKWQNQSSESSSFDELKMPDYGNPYGFCTEGTFIRTGAEYMHYYSRRIDELLANRSNRKVVMELGGGYGGLGYFLNRNIENLCYINFDLPENMALSSYYLMNCFPDKKVLVYGEEELNGDALVMYDIIIMPNFEIGNLPSESVDLAFNSYSLAEMSSETIVTYIKEIMRASKEYIFHVNHTRITNSLGAEDFGISPDLFDLVYKRFAGWNDGRFVENDEYEFLYRRKEKL